MEKVIAHHKHHVLAGCCYYYPTERELTGTQSHLICFICWGFKALVPFGHLTSSHSFGSSPIMESIPFPFLVSLEKQHPLEAPHILLQTLSQPAEPLNAQCSLVTGPSLSLLPATAKLFPACLPPFNQSTHHASDTLETHFL